MGSLKDSLLEDVSGLEISFKCPRCDERIDDTVDDTAYDAGAERASDGNGYAETTVACTGCKAEFTVQVIANAMFKNVSVVGLPDIEVEFEDQVDPDDDFWPEPPPEPGAVYLSAKRAIDDIFHGSIVMPAAKPAFNRMVYLNHIIAFEAYLSDRLRQLVENDGDRMVALVGKVASLKETQPKLIDVAKDPDIVRKHVREWFDRFSFHDFPSARDLYQALLKVDFFAVVPVAELNLETLRSTRHDLVHRNGSDRDGNVHNFSDIDVSSIGDNLELIVAAIEDSHRTYIGRRWFEPLGDQNGNA